jgi:hypothetical protein
MIAGNGRDSFWSTTTEAVKGRCLSDVRFNDFEVADDPVEIGEDRLCFRFHDRLFRVRSRELPDCGHRFPESQDHNFGRGVEDPAKDVGATIAATFGQQGKDSLFGVLNICVGMARISASSPHTQNRACLRLGA